MGKRNRKVMNFFKTSELSQRYHYHILVGGLVFVAVLTIKCVGLMNDIRMALGTIPDESVMQFAQNQLTFFAILCLFSLVFFLAAVFSYVLVITQRIGGPMVAIRAYIKDIKEGNLDAKRTLRKNDELWPIMEDLKGLADELKTHKHFKHK